MRWAASGFCAYDSTDGSDRGGLAVFQQLGRTFAWYYAVRRSAGHTRHDAIRAARHWPSAGATSVRRAWLELVRRRPAVCTSLPVLSKGWRTARYRSFLAGDCRYRMWQAEYQPPPLAESLQSN